MLLLEDQDSDVVLCQRALKRASFDAQYLTVATPQGFDAALDQFKPQVILSDFSLPGYSGLQALELARVKLPDVPFIFVSGTIGEDRAVEAMRRGATDYVFKDRMQRLVPVVERAIAESEQRLARRRAETELERTRERMDGIVASLVDIIWSQAISPRSVLFVSPAIEAIYQRPPSDFYASPDLWMQVIHPEDQIPVHALWEQTLTGVPFDAEYRVLRPDKQMRWVHDRGTAVRGADGAVVRIDRLTRDVTQRHSQQDKIDRLTRIRDVLTSINAAIVRIRDRQQLFETTCRIAVEQGNFKMAWIGVAQPDGSKVTPIAWHGHNDGYLEEVGQLLRALPKDPGIAARVLREGTPIVVNHLLTNPRFVFREAALKRGFRSCVVIPLVVDDSPVAVLSLYSAETGVFDQEEMRLLDDLAGDIGLAMAYIEKEKKLNFLAYYDALTGLCNRAVLLERLKQEIAHAHRHKRRAAIVFIDLDNFKLVNDSLGHSAGDKLLVTVASRLQAAVREEDTVARLGGDEFVVVLADQELGDNLSVALERLLGAVAMPVQLENREIEMSCSVGVSLYPDDGHDAEALIKNADVAMYRAKELGRNNFQFYEKQMNVRVNERLELQRNLRRAIENREIFVHYQPQFALATGTVVAVEALARWNCTMLGSVAPDRFIPVAEECGLIVPLGEHILESACAQMQAWLETGMPLERIAVNLSARQLRDTEFLARVQRVLERTGLSAHRLEFELTESVLVQQSEEAAAVFRALQAMGIAISVDDFGTGYSSLSYLRRYKVDRLKIDRSFVRDIATDAHDAAMTKGIIALAHSVGLDVTAEGVENEEQLRLLNESGCDEAQGYYLGMPGPAAHICGIVKHATGETADSAEQLTN